MAHSSAANLVQDVSMLFSSIKTLDISTNNIKLLNNNSSDCEMLMISSLPLNNSMISPDTWLKWCKVRSSLPHSYTITDNNARLAVHCRTILPERIFGIYSETPFLRPIALLLKASFLYPFVQIQTSQQTDLLFALQRSADNQVSQIPNLTLLSGRKITANSLGFITDSLMAGFQFFISTLAAKAIMEKSVAVVVRFAWPTTGLYVPLIISNNTLSFAQRALFAEAIPRWLSITVNGKSITLPEPIFHEGKYEKFGKRLAMSIDITETVLKSISTSAISQHLIQVSWLNAPLDDLGKPILNALSSGLISPDLVPILNLPLIQITLDHKRNISSFIKEFDTELNSEDCGPISYIKQQLDNGNLPLQIFSQSPAHDIWGLYDFCIPVKHFMSIEDVKTLLRRNLMEKSENTNKDLICADNWIPLTILCPLTRIKIQLPVRGFDCVHLQCFDLTSFLIANKNRPRWKCPICSNYCPYRHLRRDNLFLEILKDAASKYLEEITTLKLYANGSWKFDKPQDQTTNLNNESSSEDEPISIKSDSKKLDPIPLDMNVSSETVTNIDDSCIILSSDSDEEASSPPKQKKAKSAIQMEKPVLPIVSEQQISIQPKPLAKFVTAPILIPSAIPTSPLVNSISLPGSIQPQSFISLPTLYQNSPQMYNPIFPQQAILPSTSNISIIPSGSSNMLIQQRNIIQNMQLTQTPVIRTCSKINSSNVNPNITPKIVPQVVRPKTAVNIKKPAVVQDKKVLLVTEIEVINMENKLNSNEGQKETQKNNNFLPKILPKPKPQTLPKLVPNSSLDENKADFVDLTDCDSPIGLENSVETLVVEKSSQNVLETDKNFPNVDKLCPVERKIVEKFFGESIKYCGKNVEMTKSQNEEINKRDDYEDAKASIIIWNKIETTNASSNASHSEIYHKYVKNRFPNLDEDFVEKVLNDCREGKRLTKIELDIMKKNSFRTLTHFTRDLPNLPYWMFYYRPRLKNKPWLLPTHLERDLISTSSQPENTFIFTLPNGLRKIANYSGKILLNMHEATEIVLFYHQVYKHKLKLICQKLKENYSNLTYQAIYKIMASCSICVDRYARINKAALLLANLNITSISCASCDWLKPTVSRESDEELSENVSSEPEASETEAQVSSTTGTNFFDKIPDLGDDESSSTSGRLEITLDEPKPSSFCQKFEDNKCSVTSEYETSLKLDGEKVVEPYLDTDSDNTSQCLSPFLNCDSTSQISNGSNKDSLNDSKKSEELDHFEILPLPPNLKQTLYRTKCDHSRWNYSYEIWLEFIKSHSIYHEVLPSRLTSMFYPEEITIMKRVRRLAANSFSISEDNRLCDAASFEGIELGIENTFWSRRRETFLLKVLSMNFYQLPRWAPEEFVNVMPDSYNVAKTKGNLGVTKLAFRYNDRLIINNLELLELVRFRDILLNHPDMETMVTVIKTLYHNVTRQMIRNIKAKCGRCRDKNLIFRQVYSENNPCNSVILPKISDSFVGQSDLFQDFDFNQEENKFDLSNPNRLWSRKMAAQVFAVLINKLELAPDLNHNPQYISDIRANYSYSWNCDLKKLEQTETNGFNGHKVDEIPFIIEKVSQRILLTKENVEDYVMKEHLAFDHLDAENLLEKISIYYANLNTKIIAQIIELNCEQCLRAHAVKIDPNALSTLKS